MIRARHREMPRRQATLVVEALGERVVLSAASAVGLTQSVNAALDRIDVQFNRGLDGLNGLVNSRIGRADAMAGSLIDQALTELNDLGFVSPAREAALNGATNTIIQPFERFVGSFNLRLDRFTRGINEQLALAGRRFDRTGSPLESTVAAGTARLQAEETDAGARWLAELQAGLTNLQGEIGSALATIASRQPARQTPSARSPAAGGGATTPTAGLATQPSQPANAALPGTNSGLGISPFATDSFGLALNSGNWAGTDTADIGAALFG